MPTTELKLYEVTLVGVDKRTYRTLVMAVDRQDVTARLRSMLNNVYLVAEVRGQGATWNEVLLLPSAIAHIEKPYVEVKGDGSS